MNREKKDDLPKMQMSFIDTICFPIYEAFSKLCPVQMKVLLKGVMSNREAWNLLSSQPYQLNIRSPSDLYGVHPSCDEWIYQNKVTNTLTKPTITSKKSTIICFHLIPDVHIRERALHQWISHNHWSVSVAWQQNIQQNT